jgi:hypothetical protein
MRTAAINFKFDTDELVNAMETEGIVTLLTSLISKLEKRQFAALFENLMDDSDWEIEELVSLVTRVPVRYVMGDDRGLGEFWVDVSKGAR